MPASIPHYRIGEAASQAGVSAANIRYYEKEGLLAPHGRADNSYRLYTAEDIHQLRFIRLCRAMDMSLDEVRTLLGLDLRKKSDCAIATVALDEHIGHVRDRIAELKALHKELAELRSRCDGIGGKCMIIEALHHKADELPRTGPRRIPHRHV
ncbi:MerR family transcriptional regulator [Caenimonas koreensis DSM 17982]|uniref:MerR family transcriptional regulator n=1 Tax=Caenimonas koreensis DSM 17982 TaxID=1121255 RepID=A0A844BAH0_9BURK|nr:Cd(II)/Pb(II)-responsive transcriptional regulator [Caenimonas koreensis]MRD47531.1 MerR family transcriptional regulator [Caenimonas koreensis DSM 17982]